MKRLSVIFIALGLYFKCIRLSVMKFFTDLLIKNSASLSSRPVVFLCRRYEALIEKQRAAEKNFLHILFNMNSDPSSK